MNLVISIPGSPYTPFLGTPGVMQVNPLKSFSKFFPFFSKAGQEFKMCIHDL